MKARHECGRNGWQECTTCRLRIHQVGCSTRRRKGIDCDLTCMPSKVEVDEPCMPHSADDRCVCTDGKASERDISEMCE